MPNNKATSWLLADKKNQFPLHHSGPEGNYFCVHRGTSMNPTLSRHDLLEITAYQKRPPEVGDVAFFLPPNNNDYIIHRITSAGPEGFLTRGDNNNEIDPWVLNKKDVCGRVVAAHQGNKRRKIAGGFIGRLAGLFCFVRRKINGLTVKLLSPVYRSLCTSGLLHWLIPVRFTPQVATFQSDANASHKLLLGRQVIGSYDEVLLKWQIKRPYRMLIDESSLPTPR